MPNGQIVPPGSGFRNRLQRGRPRRRRQPTQPDVTVGFGRNAAQLTIADLANPEAGVRIAQRCKAVDGIVSFAIRDLLGIPDSGRFVLFDMIAQVRGRRRIELPVGHEIRPFTDLLECVLAVISPNDSVDRLERARRAAIESIVLEHPDGVGVACSRVAQAFRDAGVRGVLPQSLAKQVRELAGADNADHLTSSAAAELVAARLYGDSLGAANEQEEQQTAEVQEGFGEAQQTPALRFYKSEFYALKSNRWKLLDDSEFRAVVVRILQNAGHADRITTRFVADVRTNLTGMTLLPSAPNPLPLWIADDDSAPICSPYLAFQNGLLDMDAAVKGNVELREHDPRHFGTVMLPFDFDPAAECPLWIETLRDIFPRRRRGRRQRRDRRIRVLQEFFGYTLLAGNMSYHKFLVLVGDGANGKSTITQVWIAMLGSDNVSHVSLDGIGGEFRLWQMLHKQANIVADMNRLDKVEEGLLKNLVSGDPVQVNRKNLPLVSMHPTAKLIFGTNHLPPINDRSEGIWRRMITVPFFQQFTGDRCDLQRHERLLDELPGIFNWALEGARRILRQNAFTPCGICDACLSEHRFNSDPVAQFLEECFRSSQDERRNRILVSDVYQCFRVWCDDNGRRPMSNTEFGKQVLARQGIRKVREGRGNRGYHYVGIELSPTGRYHLRPSRHRPRAS